MRLLPLLVAALLVLTGCSGSDDPAAPEVVEHGDERASPPAGTASPPVGTASPPGGTASPPVGTASPQVPSDFNPCSGIRLAPVVSALGAALTMDLGDAETPRCGLLPGTADGPVLTVTYLPFGEGLDAVLAGMGEDPGRVTALEVPGADDARLLVAFDDAAEGRGAFVTGFLQVGGLVEVVNAADPPPYQGTHLARAVTVVLRQLAASAPR